MRKSVGRSSKYEPGKLVKMFRLAAELRNEMLAAGFTDNGGAIHSAERILNILGLRVCYPDVSHINNLSQLPHAPFSENAFEAFKQGKRVLIEHVSPHRELTRLAIQKLKEGLSDEDFLAFVRDYFQLALLTEEETTRLNRLNRSRIDPNRLANAGIRLLNHQEPETSTPSTAQPLG